MASKTAQEQLSPKAIEELLDAVDKALDRVKTLYEQYFLGIQKQAPAHLHTDIERKLRDLTQMSIRNTGLRYRLATLTQKFGSYNSYWRRTLRQIENGTYARNLSKIGREAARTGADIPDEILAAMPKRMREQVVRDRELAVAIAKRRQGDDGGELEGDDDAAMIGDGGPPPADELAAMIQEPTELRRNLRTLSGAHVVDEDDGNIDLEAFFASVENDAPAKPAVTKPAVTKPAPVAPTPPKPAPVAPPVAKPPAPPVAKPPAPPAAKPPAPPPTPRATGQVPSLAKPPATPPATPPPSPRATGQVPSLAKPPQSPPVTPPSSPRATGQVPSLSATPAVAPVTPPSSATPPRSNPPAAQAAPAAPAAPVVHPWTPIGVPASIPKISPISPIAPKPVVGPTTPMPRAPMGPAPTLPSSQATRPNPVAPGAAAARGSTPVESMSGPFPRAPTPTPSAAKPPAIAKPGPLTPNKPPPGMTDADVNALYVKYVKAKELCGETAGPGARDKLLKTINAQAPKIMEQYKAKGVDFSVVVKDNQVIIRAKPKT